MGEEAVKMQQEEPKVRPPFVLLVDLHCTGCAKKIEKSLMRIRGVEGVSIDMPKNEVTIEGIVDPQAICAKITKKTKRVAKVLSPSPPPEGEPIPQLLNSQVGGLSVLELNVSMHCEACAQQLKKKILKMRGVQTASTELSTGKVVVTGTMDGNKLVDYVYRRTKKQARIVPQPEPAQQEQNKPPQEQPPKPQENKEDEVAAAAEAAEAEAVAPPPPPPETNNNNNDTNNDTNNNNKEEEQPKPAATTAAEMKATSVEAEGGDDAIIVVDEGEDHENMRRRIYQYYQYQPLYVIERIPPPQLFSDENPNACCII